ncbi:Fe-S cluster assembly protein SufD [Gordonia liuliyuniae]|uniref:Fe-S cluster assembly protein SufD n=1 Tax=Gordonia liuliyuniae TaxID=2911517 RepID=A0ABS9IQY3_9ACTN|nr:Fe-S cluster assembly protein SufD [Gordonia liuliyuniae]MCF8587958.1 Fe-S cluster assembly protein SufD [Gordonia liuliyuniae]
MAELTPTKEVVVNKGEMFTSFDVDAFEVPGQREEAWRFTPFRRLRGLHDGTAPATATIDYDVDGVVDGVTSELVERDDPRLGEGGVPFDRIAAQAYSSFTKARVVTIAANAQVEVPVVVTLDGPGEGEVAYTHLQIRAEAFAKAVVVLDQRGSGTVGENVEIVTGDGAHLTVVNVHDWAHDTVHVAAHHISVGRDAVIRHFAISLGGDLVRLSPHVKYRAPGGDAELWGLYFADAGQHLEQRLLVDHSAPHCRSYVTYKGALQGDTSDGPGSKRSREAHTVWIGDVLIRPSAEGTDTYELNRNLVLTDNARADSVPNLEIETGEIVGAGHASATGRFDDEQLFYLQSRGIPEDQARRLVIRGFFGEVLAKISVPELRERLEAAIEAELEIAGA